MAMIGGKLNLTALHHVLMTKKGQSGQIEGVFIPIEKNKLFKSDKGNVYLDIVGFEIANPQYEDTHLVKQSIPKAEREKMTEDEIKEMPIIGNFKVFTAGEATPNSPVTGTISDEDEGDLPF